MITLNKQQEKAQKMIEEFLTNKDQFFFLFGFAGTGKTFLISRIIKNEGTVICAPTHQALNILSYNFRDVSGLTFKTIHSLLGFKPKINNRGEKIYVKIGKIKTKSKLIVIDECSMIGKDMFKALLESKLKIIFMGDSAQLPPVSEERSPVFDYDSPNRIELTEIMRTSSSAIKEVSIHLRDWEDSDSLAPKLGLITKQKKEFRMYKQGDTQSAWFKYYIQKYNQGRKPVCLSWTNKKSVYYNNMIRKHLFDTDVRCIGDLVVFTSSYSNNDDRYYTSELHIIKDLKTINHKTYNWDKFKVDIPISMEDAELNKLIKRINVKERTFKVDQCAIKDGTINAIHYHDLDEFDKYKAFVKKAIETFYDVFKSAKIEKIWEAFYANIEDKYAKIDFGYSLTVHKSQGSTYDSVFVDYNDILLNINKKESHSALYTAATRGAKDLVFVVEL